MLQNRLYRGEVVHKEVSFPGEHQAIIEEELWDAVQGLLTENRVNRDSGRDATAPSLLAGLLYDGAGERMTPTHANKRGTRYRYYVSSTLVRQGGPDTGTGRRIPAADIEGLVEGRIIAFLQNQAEVFGALDLHGMGVAEKPVLLDRAADLAAGWPTLQPPVRRGLLQHLVLRVEVQPDKVQILVRSAALPSVVAPGFDPSRDVPKHLDLPVITLSVAARLRRTGMAVRLLIDGGANDRREPDRSLLRLLSRARQFNALVMQGDGRGIGELAKEAGVTPSYFTRVLRLSFLAPDIVTAILAHRHPPDLSAKRLAVCADLPKAWTDQRAKLFA